MRQFAHLGVKKGVLYRNVMIGDDRKSQLVLPSAHVDIILESLHDDMSNPGKNRTMSLVRDRFYRPGMDKNVDNFIQQSGRCIRRKTPTNL